MALDTFQTQLADIMHVISQALLVPVILLLIAFIGYALFCIGSIVAEAFGERRNYKSQTPQLLKSLMDSAVDDMPAVIENSGLLNRQKSALLTVYDYRSLPGDALVALIRRLVSQEETHYRHIVDRNNAAAKISPMVGLMGTLIPLGPGVAALGQANTAALSSSLLIAFDTTVAGLIVAAVCLAIGKIRSNWYDDYMSALDSAMATMLEKIEALRADGEIISQEPSDYAFMFAERLKRAKEGQKSKPAETIAEKASTIDAGADDESTTDTTPADGAPATATEASNSEDAGSTEGVAAMAGNAAHLENPGSTTPADALRAAVDVNADSEASNERNPLGYQPQAASHDKQPGTLESAEAGNE